MKINKSHRNSLDTKAIDLKSLEFSVSINIMEIDGHNSDIQYNRLWSVEAFKRIHVFLLFIVISAVICSVEKMAAAHAGAVKGPSAGGAAPARGGATTTSGNDEYTYVRHIYNRAASYQTNCLYHISVPVEVFGHTVLFNIYKIQYV